MSDPAAWLRRILDEEESGWRSQAWQEAEGVAKPLFHFGQPLTELLLADIQSKRAVIARFERSLKSTREHPDDMACKGAMLALLGAVTDLTTAYAGREGYDEAWGPKP